jgi:transcriptional regulator of acetoin/glycerol metabolism
LRQHAWPGNVRELQHVLTQAALREDQPVLEGAHFIPVPASRFDTEPSTHESQRAAALQALRDAHGNKSKAAATLGVSRKTLYAWLKPHV